MTDGFVYFIKPIGADGPVKIGCSARPENRLETLMVWAPVPLEVVVTIPGDFQLEQNIHECLADLHSHHEWFHASPKITAIMDGLLAGKAIGELIDLSATVGSIRPPRVGWREHTRAYMGLFHRCRHAAKRLGYGTVYGIPSDITALLDAARERLLTPTEREKVEAFCTPSHNPEGQDAGVRA
jgi:hypothetical protein